MSPDLHHHEAGSGLKDCQFLTHLLRALDLLALSWLLKPFSAPFTKVLG